MARRSALPAAALGLWSILPCLLGLRAEVGQPREESLYLWIDAHQARVLIGKAPEPSAFLCLYPHSLSNSSTEEGEMHDLSMFFLNLISKEGCSPFLMSYSSGEYINFSLSHET